MLESDPANSAILFGLAKEYEKVGANQDVIDALNRYLAAADDQGNAYGMLARAYEQSGRRVEARATYEKGIDVANLHGHPGMAEEYRQTLASEYEA